MERTRDVVRTPEAELPSWVDQPLYVDDVVRGPAVPVLVLGAGFALVSFHRLRRHGRGPRA